MAEVYDLLGPEGFGSYEVEWSPLSLTRVSRPPRAMLVPGFVDIHIHGGFGLDFMTASPEDMLALCEKLEAEGYEGFLPTTVAASAADVKRALSVLPEHPMVLGFHLEGPFLSPKHPGAQPPAAIVDPPVGPSEWDEILDDPRLRVVTLAPELPNVLPLITRLMTRGVIVSMGHTDATFDQARHGFEFGAGHATHTFNAMRGLHHREAGMVGYALTSHALTCELIYDRLHVSREAAGILLRCKPASRVVAISDAAMAAGMPPGEIEMWGQKAVVGRGDVRLADSGALAGSAITLLDAFRNLHEDFGPETAVRACCLNPRRALGIESAPRVWLELDRDLQIAGRRELGGV